MEYMSLFDDAPIMYIIIDKKLNIINSNSLAKRTFNILRPLNIRKKSFFLLMSKSSVKSFLDWMTVQNYNRDDTEVILKTYQGDRKFKVIASEHKINKNQIILSLIDIQKEHELFEELNNINLVLEDKIKKEVEKNRQSDKKLQEQSRLAQMGEMMSMVAHQWRQPLNSISLTSSNLLFKCLMGDIEKELFERELTLINEYSQFLSQTIDDFRDFFRSDKERQKSSLTEIVERSLDIITLSITTKNIDIEVDFNNDEKLYLYQNELMQVVMNLLKNAQDKLSSSGQKNKKIKIKTYKEEDKNIISIKDNGFAIEEKILSKIFDPYFSTKTGKDGTGLGLYMSKTIVEDHHHGELTVENYDDGVCFKIIIPSRT